MYIDKNGNKWYKGNLHTHTTRSDGIKTPEQTKKEYREMGYDFIAITDHWAYGESAEADPSGLIVLSGAEY
ncbi:MAG: PHP domain-containing protein, partial [Clostridia bacterium]|nr:PHP domain-containing protein [Clostridia bacterium]